MEITELLTPDRVILDVRCRDKGQLIGEIARVIARSASSLSLPAIETALLARERLGSTGLGGGFALPHARIDGLSAFLGLFVRLAKPVDFAAIDGKPVRLVFVLLIPTETAVPHVAALAAISRRFREPNFAAKLLKAETPGVAYDLLTGQV